MPREIDSFAYYRNGAAPTIHMLYYCAHGDRTLYKYDLLTSDDGPLLWPTDSIGCTGGTLYYDSANSRLYLIFEHDGLRGMAVYENP